MRTGFIEHKVLNVTEPGDHEYIVKLKGRATSLLWGQIDYRVCIANKRNDDGGSEIVQILVLDRNPNVYSDADTRLRKLFDMTQAAAEEAARLNSEKGFNIRFVMSGKCVKASGKMCEVYYNLNWNVGHLCRDSRAWFEL
ncbi:hypothetical protein PM116P4_00026 [Parabacteroides phage PM116P4]|nr:hypothetical protein PM116P4_00026 [Parabacteroides phage PM116P4]WAX17519.1 hypothetical protein PM116P5_00003 [Parabacteroides phage PM116P5]